VVAAIILVYFVHAASIFHLTVTRLFPRIVVGAAAWQVYNPRIRVESLLVSPISRASAKQRSGR
jgi:pre-mRNA-splicing factor ATP-dependent RNA helicase DHX15/PRP43